MAVCETTMKAATAKSRRVSRTHLRFRYSRSWLDRYGNSWYLESAALLLSCTCAIATAVILGYYNDKASPKIAGLTLNAVVATLGAASKALLLFAVSNSLGQLKWIWFQGQTPRSLLDAEIFDDASRGPLGACRMLFADPKRSVASFGALLIALAIAFDPFIQLVIDYQTETRYSDSSGAIMNRAGLWQIDVLAPSMVDAYYSAFLQDDVVWQATCSSLNCRWNEFTTLAWESKCYEDEGWMISTDCNLSFLEQQILGSNNSYQTRDCSVYRSNASFDTATRLVESEIWYLDSAEVVSNESSILGSLVALSIPMSFSSVTYDGPTTWESYVRQSTDPPPNGTDVTTPFLIVNTFDLQVRPDWSLALEKATACELDLAIHQYMLNSTGNSISATLKHRQPLRKFLEWTVIDSSIFPGLVGQLYDLTESAVCFRPDPEIGDDRWFSPRVQEHPESADGIYDFSPSNTTQYCLPLYSLVPGLGSLKALMGGVRSFYTNATVFSNSTYPLYDMLDTIFDRNLSLMNELSNGPHSSSFSSDAFSMWARHGPERVMDNVAASMTKLGLDPNLNVNGTEIVYGQVGQSVSVVRVRWLWLILPYGLCIAGILFLLLTARLSHRAGSPLWKSSINALLYHGIEFDHGGFEPLSTVAEMDERAARTRALLRPTGTRGKLVLETVLETGRLDQYDDDDDDDDDYDEQRERTRRMMV